jgi:transcriptional regulator with XRE-family HTH domain
MMKLTRLRDMRERKALSQRELSAAAGISRTTLVMLETLEAEPQPRTLRKLAEALGVEPHELWDAS